MLAGDAKADVEDELAHVHSEADAEEDHGPEDAFGTNLKKGQQRGLSTGD